MILDPQATLNWHVKQLGTVCALCAYVRYVCAYDCDCGRES